MAFYLHRAFANHDSVHVLHDLRVEDPEQPEYDGKPGVCQIDHLVVHRWGMFIVECKSAAVEVQVRNDGAGGDEWTRRFGNREQGIPSPIQQARRQGEFLRNLLQRRRESLLGRVSPLLRPIATLVNGTDKKGFLNLPIQCIVAFADNSAIHRKDGWQPPQLPFRVFVLKADQVAPVISIELSSHEASSGLLSTGDGAYGLWSMQAEEVLAVTRLLAQLHCPAKLHKQPSVGFVPTAREPPPSPPDGGIATACKYCNSRALNARWGKFGYYWSCQLCSKNTPMPVTCSACLAQGSRGADVRIRKEGQRYFRHCDRCAIEECIWIQRHESDQ